MLAEILDLSPQILPIAGCLSNGWTSLWSILWKFNYKSKMKNYKGIFNIILITPSSVYIPSYYWKFVFTSLSIEVVIGL